VFTELFLNGWAWVTVIGFLLIMYGSSFFNPQWGHHEFHPWAILVGFALVVIAFVKQKGAGELR
jgi:hypothetical protein